MFRRLSRLALGSGLALLLGAAGSQAADRIFAVSAAGVPSLTVWVESTEMATKTVNGIKIPVPKRLVEKKVSKRTDIGGTGYFTVSLAEGKAATAARLCATAPKGWLVQWNGRWTNDIGEPSRTLCTGKALSWSGNVTMLELTTKAE